MSFRKLICVLTAVLTVSCCIPLCSFAAGSEVIYSERCTPELRLSDSDCRNTEEILSAWTDMQELRALLLETISNTNEAVDISFFNLPHSAWSDVCDFIFYCLPEAFNVTDLGSTHNGTQLLSLQFGYRDFADTPEEYAECFGRMKAGADSLLSGIENNFALSDVNKALLLHDRLCIYNEYTFPQDITELDHTAYGALANGSSVCQGYAMAYMYLLNRVGIKNYYVSSYSLNHAWNIVYVDGEPYHVDVTFDDINWDTKEDRNVSGGLYHLNFLVSTETLRRRDHNAYDFDSTPTDTKYDNYYWCNSESEIQLVGNKLYYIDSRSATLMCAGEDTALASVNDVWTAGGNSFWVGNFARLSSAGGELFISSSDSIYKYTVETGEYEKILTPELEQNFSIFGLTYEDGKLICDINTDPPGGDISSLTREIFTYSDISHILCAVKASTNEAYYIGDSFRPEKTVVRAYYTDNTSEIVEDGVSFSEFDSASAGKKTVIVSYKGFAAGFELEVKTPSVTLPQRISIKEDETKELSVSCDPAGLNIEWTSSSPAVQAENGKITGIKKGTAEVTAEITYNGKTYSAVCNVDVACIHKNTAVHKEIPPTTETVGYTEGVFCNGCNEYISGHTEIPKLDLSFSPSDYMKSDGTNVRIIAGKLISELFRPAPAGSMVKDKSGKAVDDSSLAATGMILVLPDGSEQEIVVVGDADGDGQISASDARTALRAAVGLESFSTVSSYFRAADVDKDNTVSASDARFVLRASVGLEDNTLWL